MGAQGDVFGGNGACGETVVGGELGVQLTTPSASLYNVATFTKAVPVLGARKPACTPKSKVLR